MAQKNKLNLKDSKSGLADLIKHTGSIGKLLLEDLSVNPLRARKMLAALEKSQQLIEMIDQSTFIELTDRYELKQLRQSQGKFNF